MKISGKHSLSSRRWLNRQANDCYVKKAHQEGYRARSAYKLLEINKKYNLLNTATNIIDLGAAPGGWSQVISIASQHKCSKIENIVGVDLLPFEPIANVKQIQGDFTTTMVQEKILHLLGGQQPDLIVSDMAPSTIGHRQTDHLRMMALLDNVLEFVDINLKTNGNYVAKIFQGSEEQAYINQLKQKFKKVVFFKPKSSRAESVEIYIIALGRR